MLKNINIIIQDRGQKLEIYLTSAEFWDNTCGLQNNSEKTKNGK